MSESFLARDINCSFPTIGIYTFLTNAAKVTTVLEMHINKRLQVVNIAKHFDSREPLEYLRGLACNYDINITFIHVSIHFDYTHLSVSVLAPKQLSAKTALGAKAV